MSLDTHLQSHHDGYASWELWVAVQPSVKGQKQTTEQPALGSISLASHDAFQSCQKQSLAHSSSGEAVGPLQAWGTQGLRLQDTLQVLKGLWTTICMPPPFCNLPLPPASLSCFEFWFFIQLLVAWDSLWYPLCPTL